MKYPRKLLFNLCLISSVVGFTFFTLLPFPHKTESTFHILLSLLLFCITSYLFWKHLFLDKLFDLRFLFNSSWLFSISLACLSLSKVQKDLTIDYLIFLLFTIISFNIGYVVKFNRKMQKPTYAKPSIYDSHAFLFATAMVLIICIGGYAYQIDKIGFIPIIKAQEEGFYNNRAEFLSIIHYFSTSLGGLAGMCLGLVFVTSKFKKAFLLLGLVALIGAASLLAKNILFITFFTFISILIFYKKLSSKRLMYFLASSVGFLLISSAVRTGDDSYIKGYSQIDYEFLPSFFYWINTYFAINISHLNTYFTEGYTPTYGTSSINLISSLLFLRTKVEELLGPQIIYYNGLGGYINVRPMIYAYLSDFGLLGFFPLAIVGSISRWVSDKFNSSDSVVYAFIYSGFAYILALSVFGDFLNRLMIPINILFLSIPVIYYHTFKRIRI